MGMSPRQVGESTLWEFQCAVDGYRAAHSTEDSAPPPMSDEMAASLGIEGF